MIRRLDGLLQGDYRTLFRGVGIDFPDLREYEPGRRRPPHRLERHRADGHAVRAPVHRGPRADGVAAARPVAVDGLRPDRPAEGARPQRARDDLRPAAHPRRQPRRRDPLRQRGRGARSPPRQRPEPGARARPASCMRPPGPQRRRHRPDAGCSSTPHARDPAPLAGLPRLRLHHRARLGAPAAAAHGAPRGRRDPPARPARVRAARRRRDRGRGRRDRRAARRRLQRPRVPAAAPRGRASTARPSCARRRSAPASTSTRCRPRTTSCRRSSGSSSRASGGAADVARLAVAAALLLAASPRWSSRTRGRCGCAPSGPPGSRSEGLVPTAAARERAWRRHVPFALFAAALALVCFALARPTMSVALPQRRGHGDPRLRRVEQHARRGPRADADRGGEEAAARRSSSGSRARSASASSRSATAPSPSCGRRNVKADVHRRDQAALGRAAGRRSARGSSRRSARSRASRSRSTSRRSQSDAGARSNIGFFGSSAIVLLSDGENTSRLDPLKLAEVASAAGVRVHTIGVGTKQGTVVEIDGFSVATALDEDLLKKIADVTDGTYHEAERRRRAREHLQVDRPRVQARRRSRRGDRRCSRRRGAAPRARLACSRSSGSGG